MSRRDDVRCVWVSGSRSVVAALRQRDLDAVRRWSIQGVWVALRGSWYVFSSYRSDVNLWLGDGARTFNLWHGVGVKRIQRDRVVGAGAGVFAAPQGSLTARVFADDRHRPDVVLSTSEGMGRVLSRAFDVPRDRCPPLGYPCNDHLAAGLAPPAPLVDGELYRRLSDRPVIGYFPTYRDDSVTLPGGSDAVVERLAQVAESQGALLLFKAHSASVVPLESGGALVVLPKTADLNAYLGVCDVLVTDYSSVASDFLLLDRPIVLFCPDLEAYDGNRGFALDPHEFLPGIQTSTPDELVSALSDIRSIPRSINHRRSLGFYWDERARGGACERIAAFLLGEAEPSPI
jgi:CDP-glycerol glycerophosphotransferase